MSDPPLELRPRVWYNEALISANMIVPGLVAVIMMIISAMLTALTVAREWERGTMEQLAATPVHRLEVIGGKLIPYLGIGLIDVTAAIFNLYIPDTGVDHRMLKKNQHSDAENSSVFERFYALAA